MALRPPSPLGTVQAAFTAYGSSRIKALRQQDRSGTTVFPVTRFTAKALPLNEWVSNRCKALTLPQRPSRVAFTIRACSLRTRRSQRSQSIWSHCDARAEDAHVDDSTLICNLLPGKVLPALS